METGKRVEVEEAGRRRNIEQVRKDRFPETIIPGRHVSADWEVDLPAIPQDDRCSPKSGQVIASVNSDDALLLIL